MPMYNGVSMDAICKFPLEELKGTMKYLWLAPTDR